MNEPGPVAPGAARANARGAGGVGARDEGARPARPPGAKGEAGARDAEAGAGRRRRFHCGACEAHVADHDDLFVASGAGATGFFVNPAGCFFELVTLRRARSVEAVGAPTPDATWFAGYAWQIALCARCAAHLGWRYVAAGAAEPATFYGLIRTALVEREG